MKTSSAHIIATKRLVNKERNFHLNNGTLVFLKNASLPMIEWLQEVYTNDPEAVQGNTDVLMGLFKPSSNQKKESLIPKSKRKHKKQLFFRLRSPRD